MAAGGGTTKMAELSTKADMITQSKKYPNKVIAVLFNPLSPERGTLESKLSWWRHTFEKEHEVIFCKRVCNRDQKQLNDEFQIKMVPAFIFFRNGKEIGSLKDLNETKPEYYSEAKPNEDTDDEKTVKNTIIALCKSAPPKESNTNQ